MEGRQLGLFSVNPECPFKNLIEYDDTECYSLAESHSYDVISENDPVLGRWLADISGVYFENVFVKETPDIKLPSFLPTINGGGKKINTGAGQFVAISLGTIVSIKQLKVRVNIREVLGLTSETKLVLLSYGKDELIENIWPKRWDLYKTLLGVGIDLITSINYSIWFNQNHCEHLINVKRNLLTFQEMQKVGLPAIPNVYWYGQKDLFRWATWLNSNPLVKLAAINLQTLRTKKEWSKTISDLKYFSGILKNNIQFLITGPSSMERINQIKEIFPSVSFTNKYCSMMAASGMRLTTNSSGLLHFYSKSSRKYVFRKNISLFKKMTSKGIPTDIKNKTVSSFIVS